MPQYYYDTAHGLRAPGLIEDLMLRAAWAVVPRDYAVTVQRHPAADVIEVMVKRGGHTYEAHAAIVNIWNNPQAAVDALQDELKLFVQDND